MIGSCGARLHPFLPRDLDGIAFSNAEAAKVFERVTKFYGLSLRSGTIPKFLTNGPVVGPEYADRSADVVTVTNGQVKDPLNAAIGVACNGTNASGQPVSGTLKTIPRVFGYLYCLP